MCLFCQFLREEEGQTAVEYILLVALSLALLLVGFATAVGIKGLTDGLVRVLSDKRNATITGLMR